MIFRRLNEAPDYYPDEPISAVSRRPSDVTVGNFPDETKELIKQGKWTEAYKTLINPDDIEEFIKVFIYQCDLLKSFSKQVTKIYDPLVRLMRSLGDRAYQPETNPMLTFLNSYFAQGNEFDSADQFKALAGWWGDGIVIDKNLKETKVENSILLNPNLYNMSNNTFIVQAYYWLGDKKNVKAYLNLETTKDLDAVKSLEKQIKYILGPQGRTADGRFDFKKVDYKKFRDLIIFVNPESPRGPINEASEIQARLSRMQDAVNAAKGDEEEADLGRGKTYNRRYSKDDINRILSSGINKLTQDDIETLLSYFTDRGFIG